MSEDLEAFEQGERGSPPFALSSGRFHGYQLGGGRGWQLLVAGSGEGGDTEQRFVLADVDGWYQMTAPTPPPRPSHCLVEDVLHREEVQTGRHLEEQTAKMRCQGLSITLPHLPERKSGFTRIHSSLKTNILLYCVITSLTTVFSARYMTKDNLH